MKKRIYKVAYIEQELHDGQYYDNIEHKIIYDTIENIKNKYSIYYLTDIDGNVIIDNSKEELTKLILKGYTKEEKIKNILISYSQIDEGYHKAWCLDQIARIIYGEEYQDFIYHYEYIDDDGVEHDEPICEWDCGIAP